MQQAKTQQAKIEQAKMPGYWAKPPKYDAIPKKYKKGAVLRPSAYCPGTGK